MKVLHPDVHLSFGVDLHLIRHYPNTPQPKASCLQALYNPCTPLQGDPRLGFKETPI